MTPIRVTISQTGTGTCALTGREGDGLTVAFDGEPPIFLSWKALRQLVTMKAGRRAMSQQPVSDGPAVTK